MADDQRKPWVLPVFFGLLIVLFWLVTDLMKAPAVEEVPPPASAPEAVSPTAQAAQ